MIDLSNEEEELWSNKEYAVVKCRCENPKCQTIGIAYEGHMIEMDVRKWFRLGELRILLEDLISED